MAFKVQVGPAQIAIHQGQTVLVTRVISAWAIYANGTPWDLLNGGAVAYSSTNLPGKPRFHE
jgi:hypothetical protein